MHYPSWESELSVFTHIIECLHTQCIIFTIVGHVVIHFRCFTFGIGSGASTALVEGLARAGNGTAEFVKEGERMQPKVCM